MFNPNTCFSNDGDLLYYYTMSAYLKIRSKKVTTIITDNIAQTAMTEAAHVVVLVAAIMVSASPPSVAMSITPMLAPTTAFVIEPIIFQWVYVILIYILSGYLSNFIDLYCSFVLFFFVFLNNRLLYDVF